MDAYTRDVYRRYAEEYLELLLSLRTSLIRCHLGYPRETLLFPFRDKTFFEKVKASANSKHARDSFRCRRVFVKEREPLLLRILESRAASKIYENRIGSGSADSSSTDAQRIFDERRFPLSIFHCFRCSIAAISPRSYRRADET